MQRRFRSFSVSTALCAMLVACGTSDQHEPETSSVPKTDASQQSEPDVKQELEHEVERDVEYEGVTWGSLNTQHHQSTESLHSVIETKHGSSVSDAYGSFVAFGARRSVIVTGSHDDARARLWDVKNGRLIATFEGSSDRLTSVALSSDGKVVAAGSADNTARLWNVKSRRRIATLRGHSDQVTSVAFAPDGKFVATGSGDATARLWDVSNGGHIVTLTGHSQDVNSVAYSPNGRVVATGSDDKTARLWDVRNGLSFATLSGHSGSVTSVAFSPDGVYVATGSSDGTGRVWYVSSGRLLATIDTRRDKPSRLPAARGGRSLSTTDAHRENVTSVAFSPDGKLIAKGTGDLAIFADAQDGKEFGRLHVDGDVGSIAFSPDGKFLAVALRRNPTRIFLADEFIKRRRSSRATLPNVTAGERIATYVNDRMIAWSARPLTVKAVGREPTRSRLPDLPELEKGEFETTQGFKARVAEEQRKYDARVEKIDAAYRADVEEYNEDVERYRKDLALARAARKAAAREKRNQLLSEAMGQVYGQPILDNLVYDADAQRFSAVLKSSKGQFSESVVIDVPIEHAKSLKPNIDQASLAVEVSANDGQLRVSTVRLLHNGSHYSGRVSTTASNHDRVAVRIAPYTPRDTSKIPALRPVNTAAVVSASEDYFTKALGLGNDPDVVRERQKLAAALQKQRDAEIRRRKAEHIKQLREQTENLERSLRSTAPADPQLASAVSKIPQARTDTHKYLFALAIEDYSFAPDVPNADNSLKVVTLALSKRLGIPEENVITISGEHATAGFIRSELADLLSRLKPSDSLYFYYSGHSIPGTVNPDKLFLAPKDTQTKQYEDPNFAMDSILRQFRDSDVGKVYGFLDTCFSGKASHDSYIFEGIGTLTRGRGAKLPPKVAMFYAATGDQYANDWADRGHRLFSYYLADGLAKGHMTTKELGSYIRNKVERISRRRGRTYAQTPYFEGSQASLR